MTWHQLSIWLNALFHKKNPNHYPVHSAYWKHHTGLWWPPSCTQKVPERLVRTKPVKDCAEIKEIDTFLKLTLWIWLFISWYAYYLWIWISVCSPFESILNPTQWYSNLLVFPDYLNFSQLFLFSFCSLLTVRSPCQPLRTKEDTFPAFILGI